MAVTVSGMFGSGRTYFADSPVVIDISGLEWPSSSPFYVVSVTVIYNGEKVGKFRADTGRQGSISFDISSALRSIWADVRFEGEVSAANNVLNNPESSPVRPYRSYSLILETEYINSTDGELYGSRIEIENGGNCTIGEMTERERSILTQKENADVSHLQGSNQRNGDASTKPASVPERVGSISPTSWVDVQANGTQSVFYPAITQPAADSQTDHAPIVLRDSIPYADFLFLNRRGAIETCSALMKESMEIEISSTQYARVERPAFIPSRPLMAIGTDGRRSWQMSSGYVTREWAEWWAMEFLGGKRKQWWMRYPIGEVGGTYVPVIVEPAKQNISIYDRSKQNMPHVDFTVTLALEG